MRVVHDMSRGRVDPTSRWPMLQAAITADVALPGSIDYDQVDRPFNARFHHVRPQAIVRCATPEDVSETISFLARHGLESAIRSGGHCFAGHSSTRGVVIDVTPMGTVSVSGDVATVGAGRPLGRRGRRSGHLWP
jgi:FAD/FMN-containing dehydrogenase